MEDKNLQKPNQQPTAVPTTPDPSQSGVLASQNSPLSGNLSGEQIGNSAATASAPVISVAGSTTVMKSSGENEGSGVRLEPTKKRPSVKNTRRKLFTLVVIILLVLLLPVAYVIGGAILRSYQAQQNDNQFGKNDYIVTSIPLSDLVKNGEISFDANRQVNVNGQLRINNSFVLTPSDTPNNPLIGQFYLNQQNTQLYYYNGNQFIDLATGTQISQLSAAITAQNYSAGAGLALLGNQFVNTGVLALPQDLTVTAAPTFAGLNLGSALTVGNGGTGATTAAGARINLGAAASGVNADITSLNALTVVSPTGGVNYQFAAAPAGTYEFCTSAGNCATAGTITGSGTAGRIAKFTAGQVLADSLLSEAASTVTVNGDLAVTGTASGDGSGLTNLNASNLATGTVADGRLSSNVALLDRNNQVFTGSNQIFRNTVDSAAAFDIQNAASQSLFKVDSSNNQISVAGNNSAELSSWTATSSLPGNVNGSRAVVSNGYVYSAGGSLSVAATYSAKLNADGSTGAWNTTSSLITPVNFSSPVTANDYIYVVGGQSTGGVRLATVQYAKLNADGTIGTWGTTTSLPDIRVEHFTTVANGYIYVIGGINDSFVPQTTAYYAKLNADGTVGTWNTTTALPVALESAGTATANGYIYALAGKTSNGTCAATCSNGVYYAKLNANGTIGAWQVGNNTNFPSMVHTRSVVMNGYMYAIGGYSTSEANVNTVFYTKLNADGSNGPWTQAASSLPVARHAPSLAAVNGYVYVIGGAGDQTSVIRASGPRLQVGASLDLVGLGAGVLTEQTGSPGGGSLGGSITAGDARILGLLDVTGQARLQSGLTVNGNIVGRGQGLFQNDSNSTTAFQVQNASSQTLLVADTTNSRVGVGNAAPQAALHVSDPGTGGDLFRVTDTTSTAADVFKIANEGAVTVRTRTDTANAFSVGSNSFYNSPSALSVDTNYTNYGQNNSFETDTAGWAALGAATISRTTTQAASGSASLQVSTPAVGSTGANFPLPLSAFTTYTFSFYMKANSSFSTMRFGYNEGFGNIPCASGQSVTTNWKRYSCTFTTGFALVAPSVYFDQSDGVARTIYLDAMQMEAGSYATGLRNGGLQLNGAVVSPTFFQNAANSDTAFVIQNANASTKLLVADTVNGLVTLNQALVKPVSNSTTAFQVQNSSGQSLLTADTTNQRVAVGPAAVPANSVLTVGTNTTTASGGITFGTDTNLYRSGSGLKTDGGFEAGSLLVDDGGGSFIVTSSAELLMSVDSTVALRIQDSGGSSILLQADTNNSIIRTEGDVLANNTATGTTATTSGTGSDTTTVTLTGAAFANNDVVYIDNAGQDYVTRVLSGGGTATLTVSPAVTFENSRTVTKYNIQNIGATDSDYTTLSNRFFQGYFLGGIVAGAGSTRYADASIDSTQTLHVTAPNFIIQNSAGTDQFSLNTATGEAIFAGDLTVNGSLNATVTGDGSGLNGLNASNISSGTLADGYLSSNVGLLDRLNQTFTGTNLFKTNSNSTTALQIQNASSQTLFVADTTNQRIAIGPAAVPANGVLTIGTNTTTAAGGIYFGTDVSLYRVAASQLQVGGSLSVSSTITSSGNIGAQVGGVGDVRIGAYGPGGEAAVRFGSAGDTNLYRSASNTLKTDDSLIVQPTSGSTTAFQVLNSSGNATLSVDSTNARLGIGTSAPTQSLTINQGSMANILLSPTGVSATPSASGGTLATGTYYYKIAAIDALGGETLLASSGEITAAVTGPTGSVALSWSAAQGAASYRVYRGTSSGGQNTYYSVSTNSYVDTGSAGTAGTGSAAHNAYQTKISNSGATIFNGGNVGIGVTSSPSATLTVGGSVLFRNATDSSSAFHIQNAAGSTVFAVNTSDATVGIGTSPSNSTGKLSIATGYIGLSVNQLGTNDILKLQNNGTNVLTVNSTGGTIFKNSTNSTAALQIQNSSSSVLFAADTTNQRIGVGTATPSSQLHVVSTASGAGSYKYALQVENNPGGSTARTIGTLSFATVGDGALPTDYFAGVEGRAISNATSGTIPAGYGLKFGVENRSTGTINTAIGVDAYVNNYFSGGTGTINNAIGLRVDVSKTTGTIGSGYGVYINDVTATSQWGVYQAGADDLNYFAGNLGLGVSSGLTSRINLGSSTAASGGIAFGTDTNLYRSAASTLKTDSSLQVAANLQVNNNWLTTATNGTAFGVGIGTASPTSVGANRTVLHVNDNTGNGAEIRINTTGSNARLYNNGTEFGFGTDSNKQLRFFVNGGSNSALTLGTDLSATINGPLIFNGDTTLYRDSADVLKTNDSFVVRNSADSATAFVVQNSSGTALLTADASNMTITVQKLIVSGDLTVNGHLITGGSAPSASVDANAGTSATCTVSGTDTAGKITLVTGSSGVTPGTQCSITFSSAYGAAPKVVIGPAGPLAAPLDPYIDAVTASSFSVGVGTAGATGTTYTFNYVSAQ